MKELAENGYLILTYDRNGKTADNLENARILDRRVIRSVEEPYSPLEA